MRRHAELFEPDLQIDVSLIIYGVDDFAVFYGGTTPFPKSSHDTAIVIDIERLFSKVDSALDAIKTK
jgi:hypothetical protein